MTDDTQLPGMPPRQQVSVTGEAKLVRVVIEMDPAKPPVAVWGVGDDVKCKTTITLPDELTQKVLKFAAEEIRCRYGRA